MAKKHKNKLTVPQREMVLKNHNLIYWYIGLHSLNHDDVYGTLAITLCDAVIGYDKSKGSFSTYFKSCADSAMAKEYRKTQSQKRNFETVNLDHDTEDTADVAITDSDLIAYFGEKNFNVIKLKYEGYNQIEIAEKLGVSQSTVSHILCKAREEYMDGK